MAIISAKSGVLAISALTTFGLASATDVLALDLKGKKVTWVVPFREGGGTDRLARLLQAELAKNLPGKPAVIVLNQPGGGSVKGANKFSRTAKKDGTMILGASTSTMVPVTLGAKKVKYDPGRDWRAIVGFPRGTVLYANPKLTGIVGGGKDIVADVKAMRKAKLVFGPKTPTSAELVGLLTIELLGAKVKPVFGLSTSKQRKAFLRGELNINGDGTGPYLTKLAKLEKKGTVTPIVSHGYRASDGTIKRDPDIAHIPTVGEAYKAVYGKAPKGLAWEAYLNMMNNKVSLSKAIALPKGVSDDIFNTYTKAFKAVVKNKQIAKKLKKEVGSLPLTWGKETDAAIAAGTQMKPEVRAWVDSYLKKNFGAKL